MDRSSWLTDIRVGATKKGSPKRPAPYKKKRQGGYGVTPAQDEVAAFIRAELGEGRQPTAESIRAHMGWAAVSSVRACLRTMAQNGKLPDGVPGYSRTELLQARRGR